MPNDDNISRLTVAAQDLVREINDLNEGTGKQMVRLTHTARTNRKLIWLLAVSLAADVFLTIVIAMGILQISNLTHKVDQAQSTTQAKVLCPLYQQFINSDTPASRALAQKNGQDMETRAEAFKVIRQGYDTLKCVRNP